jgi:gas vesicle protein
MADGYDRFEGEGGNGGGSFVMGLLTGTVLGAGLGILFAPKAGSEMRNQLSEQAGNLANQAQDGIRKVSENAGEWADRGREMYGKAKDAVAKGADEAQKYVRDNAGTVKDAAAKGVDEAQKYVRDTANTIRETASPSTASASGTSGSSFGTGSTYGGSSESLRGSHVEPTPGSQPGGSSTGGSRRS